MMLVKLLERVKETRLSEEYFVDLGEHVGVNCEVEHCDEGLLHSRVSIGQGLAVNWSCDALEDDWEELRVETANVTQRNCGTRLQALVESGRQNSLFDSLCVHWMVQEDSQQVVDGLKSREFVPC